MCVRGRRPIYEVNPLSNTWLTMASTNRGIFTFVDPSFVVEYIWQCDSTYFHSTRPKRNYDVKSMNFSSSYIWKTLSLLSRREVRKWNWKYIYNMLWNLLAICFSGLIVIITARPKVLVMQWNCHAWSNNHTLENGGKSEVELISAIAPT